jgi:putative membrane protein
MRLLLVQLTTVALTLLSACGSEPQKDPIAEAKFQNEKRIGDENVTEKQERDADFMVHAASQSMLEMEMSQIAQRKASSPDTKYLAQTIIGEHGAMQTALKQLAGRKSIVLPASLGEEQSKPLGELAALNGPAFDRKYVELLEDHHKVSIDEFDEMSEEAYDGDIRAFAANHLATLKNHREAADKLADKLDEQARQ